MGEKCTKWKQRQPCIRASVQPSNKRTDCFSEWSYGETKPKATKGAHENDYSTKKC